MAGKGRNLDVWIIETNTVYRQVPYLVVVDWIQQSRLLEDDMLRPAGKGDWRRLGDVPAFAAYLPRSEPYRVDDQAEALQRVQLDFSWKPSTAGEEEDVDMIPLIDVSLVLLLFFMMTATVAIARPPIAVSESRFTSLLAGQENMLWVGIDLKKDRRGEPVQEDGRPILVYFLGRGPTIANRWEERDLPERRLSVPAALGPGLASQLRDANSNGVVYLVRGRSVPFGAVKGLVMLLEDLRSEGVRDVRTLVSEGREP